MQWLPISDIGRVEWLLETPPAHAVDIEVARFFVQDCGFSCSYWSEVDFWMGLCNFSSAIGF